MVWLLFIVLSTLIFSICNVFDKFILEKRINNFLIYFIIGGIAWLIFGLIVFAFLPPLHLSWPIIGLSILSGLLMGLNWLIFYKALTKEDVSRVITIFYIFPIFVAIWAWLLLHESISPIKWLAIFFAISGTIIISLKKESIKAPIRICGAFLLILLGAAIFEPGVEIIDKYVLSQISPWPLLALNAIGFSIMAISFLVFSASARQQTWQFFKTNRPTLKIIIFAHLIYFFGNLLFLLAVPFTKITYVATVSVIQPVFVFILTLILSMFRPKILKESLSIKTILIKTFAIVLIVASILIITLA
ncbi:MAG: EamA family transporter [Patescibacteria group bacterium]|nr:EamA family transporter [Patescibacteria group bacterium]MDD5121092.1 EamA family transporter [Patescibacteria group bacterium]MDD5221978.1 EamA family transporter [Patescibacteria group bacterium]MDD5395989.1 EamA family transporter [Patescibacteria group bacterium]